MQEMDLYKYNKYAHSFMCIFPSTLLFVCNSQLNSPTCNLRKCEMCEKHTVCRSETPVAQYCSRINSNYWTFCAHLILCSRVLQGTESSKHISHKSRVTGLFPRSNFQAFFKVNFWAFPATYLFGKWHIYVQKNYILKLYYLTIEKTVWRKQFK